MTDEPNNPSPPEIPNPPQHSYAPRQPEPPAGYEALEGGLVDGLVVDLNTANLGKFKLSLVHEVYSSVVES